MKKIIWIAFFLVFYVTNWVSAQCPGTYNSPEPICIRVMPNGDIEIDYDLASIGGATPLDIHKFELRYSPTGIVFNPVDSLVFGSSWPLGNKFIWVGANQQNTTAAYFKIIAYCEGSLTPLPDSKVISAIKLKGIVSNDFFVDLSWRWDSVITNGQLVLNRKLPISGPWSIIGSPTYPTYLQGTMAYNDTVITCDDSVNYKVLVINQAKGCQSQSSEWRARIIDDTDPKGVVIDSATFDPVSGRPKIGWKASTSDDVYFYEIYHHFAGDCGSHSTPKDTVFGKSNTQFVDFKHYPGTGTSQYSIIVFDQCGNASQPSPCARTMFLSPTVDVCDKSVRLDWNHYSDFASGTDVLYKIFVQISGSEYVYVGQTTDDFFIHEDPVQDNILTYKIVAFENGGLGPFTATSNPINVDAEFLRKPEFQYLRYADVDADNYVKLELYTDIKSDAATYILKRALDTGDVYGTVNVFHAPKIKILTDSIITMSDRSPITDLHPYYYKVDLYDSCGAYMSTSNIASTSLLKVEANHTSRVNRLEWSNVLGWKGGTFAYRIYRFLDGKPLREPLTKFPDSGRTTVYYDSLLLINDNITQGNPSQGEYCYHVMAIENEPTFGDLLPAVSYSNEACVVQEPYISVPNAFTPNGDGRNETFQPVVVYHDISNYEFIVMDRYGEIIYQTKNVAASWDGSFDGKPVPQGVYVYMVKYRASTGEEYQNVGTVALIR